jgi:Holliday junction resolvase RusA-like endonuclease
MTRKNIVDFSDEDLIHELERRKKARNAPPTPVPNPDFSNLVKTIVDCLEESIRDQYEVKDFEQYVYEEAMKAVYGPDFFEWRNKQSW